MSPKNSFLKASLSALGLFGLAVSGVADPPASIPPGQAPSAAPKSPLEDAVLLKSDGKVLRGTVTETPTGYLLRQRANTLPLTRASVQGVFRSLDEAYRFQAEHLPARDPDEQMKLARWCMTNHLMAEAKKHLQTVVALSPHSPAEQMLNGIELAEARATPKDVDVQRAGAEMPREMSMTQTRPPRRLGPIAPPQIFDLPQAVAFRRANEFAQYVQPVLQRVCAGCHNERSAREFQLVQFRSKHDHTPDAYRMNLDATLLLVNRDDPSKSELLSSCLRPHGDGPRKRPIFVGSNNPDYQVLSTWVNSLGQKSPSPKEAIAPAERAASAEGEGFAADRSANRTASLSDDPPFGVKPVGPPAALNVPPRVLPAKRFVQGQGLVNETAPPGPGEFPVPFAVSGAAPPKAPAVAPGAAPPGELPPLQSTAIPPPVPAPGASSKSAPAPKTPRKPVKLDEALLQQVLQNRNGAK